MTQMTMSPTSSSHTTSPHAGTPSSTQVSQELAGLRKEVVEARNLIIKTDNLLKTFHLELKAVASKQELFERRHFMGHVAAYVVIGVLAAGGSLLYAHFAGAAGRAHAAQLVAQAEHAKRAAQKSQKQAAAVVAARNATAKAALEAYHLMTSGSAADQAKGLEQVAALKMSQLDPFSQAVIGHTARTLAQSLAGSAYDAGVNDYRRGRAQPASAELARYLTYASQMPAAWQAEQRTLATYYLGAAYNQLGQHNEAVTRLQAFVDHAQPSADTAYAYLLMGDSLQALGRKDDARQAFKKGIAAGGSAQTQRALAKRLDSLPPS